VYSGEIDYNSSAALRDTMRELQHCGVSF